MAQNQEPKRALKLDHKTGPVGWLPELRNHPVEVVRDFSGAIAYSGILLELGHVLFERLRYLAKEEVQGGHLSQEVSHHLVDHWGQLQSGWALFESLGRAKSSSSSDFLASVECLSKASQEKIYQLILELGQKETFSDYAPIADWVSDVAKGISKAIGHESVKKHLLAWQD